MQLDTNGGIIVGSASLPPDQTTTVGGKQVSVAPEGVVVDSSTYPYAVPVSVVPYPTPAASIQVGGQQLQRAPNGQGVDPGGFTIANSGQATVGEHMISAGLNNIMVVQISYNLPSLAGPTPVVIDGQTAQKASANGVMFAGSPFLLYQRLQLQVTRRMQQDRAV